MVGKETTPHSVAVVGDDPAVCASIKLMLDRINEFLLIESLDWRRASRFDFHKAECEIVIMDLDMRGHRGYEQGLNMHGRFPELRIITLTANFRIAQLVSTLEWGSCGFLVKPVTLETLRAALLAATVGLFTRPIELSPLIRRAHKTVHRHRSILSERERAVLRFVGRGLDDKSIAQEMNVSLSTVRTYLRRLFEKLSVHRRCEALDAGRMTGEID